MNNKISITLSDGIERSFQFTLGVMKRLGKKPGDVINDIPLWDLVWAGLSKADREGLTPEDVADLMPVDPEFLEKLTSNLVDSFPAPESAPNLLPAQPNN